MKKLLHQLYSLFVFGSYFICMAFIGLFLLAILWLPAHRRLVLVYQCAHFFTQIWSFTTGIHFKRKDTHWLDPHTNYVIVSNHVNVLDILMVGTLLRIPMYSLAKKSFFKVPILGQILRALVVPVDRRDATSRVKSKQLMLKKIAQGFSILIFPEGTRNRSEAPLQPFYNGAFQLAIQGQVPILPILLLDSKELQPVNSWLMNPGIATLQFCEPISTTGLEISDTEKLKQQVWQLMHNQLQAHVVENDQSTLTSSSSLRA